MARYRVKAGASWHGGPPGEVVEVDEASAAIVPWCLERIEERSNEPQPAKVEISDDKPASSAKQKSKSKSSQE